MTEEEFKEFGQLSAMAMMGILSNPNRMIGPVEAAIQSCHYAEELMERINESVNTTNMKIVKIDALKKTVETQQELIELLEEQVIELTILSKIELGDDVIEKIKTLKSKL